MGDGKVDHSDFDIMVERAGALPRKWGFAPTSAEAFPDPAQRQAHRQQLFAIVNKTGCGKISFNEWLEWAYTHICEKARVLSTMGLEAQDRHDASKEAFRDWIIKATQNKQSHEYKEFYHFLQDCFTKADRKHVGMIGPNEFDEIIEVAADLPRKFGYAPPANQTYRSEAERKAAREQMFRQMDRDNDGAIAFDEWLQFVYEHCCGKVAGLLGGANQGFSMAVPPAGATYAASVQTCAAPGVYLLRNPPLWRQLLTHSQHFRHMLRQQQWWR